MSAGREQPPLAQRIERARRVVSHCSQAAIRAYDEEALLSEACRTLIDQGDYCMAWFAEARAGEDRVATIAHAVASTVSGVREDRLPWSAELGPRMPTMRALLEQRPCVARDIPHDPVLAQRHPDAESQGYASISAFPMQFGPYGAGVLTIHAREPDAFAPEEVALLRELAGDMAVAVSVLRARKANDLLEERLEAAERRYRSIVEHAPVGIIQVDADGRLLMANHALAEMLGLPAGTDVTLLPPGELGRHIDADDLQRLRDVAQAPQARPLQMRLRRLDGEPVWAEVSAKPANGGSEGAIEAFVRDLTGERAVATFRIAQERQRLEVLRLKEIDRMRADFMGRASHELNTPLTPILLQVQALQAEGQDARMTRGLALIERNVLRLAGLVKDLLSASSIESGHAELRPASIDLARMAADVADSFRDQAQRAGIELGLRSPADVPVPAYADGQRVAQVLFNLVGNAIKFTPRGGTVAIECQAGADGMSQCSVVDNGRGFEPEQQAKLFEPFGRLHEHLPGDPGGTGLGLFISKAILEQSGGQLWARSPGPGQGSVFGFTLPAHAPPAEAREPTRASDPPGRGIRAASGFAQPPAIGEAADLGLEGSQPAPPPQEVTLPPDAPRS